MCGSAIPAKKYCFNLLILLCNGMAGFIVIYITLALFIRHTNFANAAYDMQFEVLVIFPNMNYITDTMSTTMY